ncbi:MAG: hypothetical protein ACTHM2_12395 [Afipia sp.]
MLRTRRAVVFNLIVAISLFSAIGDAHASGHSVNTLQEMFAKLKECWVPPALPRSRPGMEITVLLSFKRDGEILGHPRITYESAEATDNERLKYRIAVMKTLESCTPMAFTDQLGGAIAGRTFRVRFDDRRRKRKPVERQAWLTQKIL